MLINNTLIIKIKSTKNNTFLTLLTMDGTLLFQKSLGSKVPNDFKLSLSQNITLCLKQIQQLQIQHIFLYLYNISANDIQFIYNLILTWKINISFYTISLKLPHNGCRYPHKSRKKKQQFKKAWENNYSLLEEMDTEFELANFISDIQNDSENSIFEVEKNPIDSTFEVDKNAVDSISDTENDFVFEVENNSENVNLFEFLSNKKCLT